MKLNKGKSTIKGLALFCFAFIFIALLAFTTIESLAPITAERIESYQGIISELEEDKADADSDEMDSIEKNIAKNASKIEMLQNRENNYKLAIILIIVFLCLGCAYSVFAKAYFIGPISALSILLAIGFSFKTIITIEFFDVLMLASSMVLAVVAYLFFRTVTKMQDWLYTALFLITVIVLLVNSTNLIFDKQINGAYNWMQIGPVQVQPSELVKVLLVVLGAYSFQPQRGIFKWEVPVKSQKHARVIAYYALSVFSCVIMLILRDLGTAMVFFVLALMMTIFLLDDTKKFIAAVLGALALLIIGCILLSHVRVRFENCWHAMDNPVGQQAQVIRSLIFGGLGGLGFENSSHILKIYSIDSDVIISGITAVFGVGMLIVVMLCYSVFVVLPNKNISVYPWSYYVTAQFSIIIAVQALLNLLGSVDVLPFTGIVAPYLSNGGSSSLAFFMLFGLVIAALNPKVVPKVPD